ncbi:hypothetical protein EDC04DRAFT_2541902, partial [Pisolithus marmoratus]
KDCQHLRVAFLECGIGIAWFSCAREFFNAVMGIVVGHFNGYVCRKVHQCDISDTNTWLQILKPKPEFVIPDWPEDKDLKWYPKWMGMLGDWGYGKDFDGSGSHLIQVLQGTFPFQAIQIMAWEVELPWAGPFTGHSIQHDLEVIMWLVWVLCINLDGPF